MNASYLTYQSEEGLEFRACYTRLTYAPSLENTPYNIHEERACQAGRLSKVLWLGPLDEEVSSRTSLSRRERASPVLFHKERWPLFSPEPEGKALSHTNHLSNRKIEMKRSPLPNSYHKTYPNRTYFLYLYKGGFLFLWTKSSHFDKSGSEILFKRVGPASH